MAEKYISSHSGSEIDDGISKISNLESQLESLSSSYENTIQEVSSLESIVNELSLTIDNLNNTINTLSSGIQVLENQLDSTTQDLEDVTERLTPSIGEIYISTSSANPSTKFPGTTWQSFGAGRALVGVDTSQSEFNTVEKTGGAKTHTLTLAQIPSHSHTQKAHRHNFSFSSGDGKDTYIESAESAYVTINTNRLAVSNMPYPKRPSFFVGGDWSDYGSAILTESTPTINSSGSGNSHNNLQPYITCYI